MRLSELYSNKPEKFNKALFSQNLNVILAEIRIPENRKKDTHNLGKTTFGRLLDFCFLSKRKKDFFLFKHYEIFKDFVFFLEIELDDGSYLTIRRSVKESTKIWFKKHKNKCQDFSKLPDTEWDHRDVPFERAREMLDNFLDWQGVKPWTYRQGLGYQLRTQDDYRDVFQLRKFSFADYKWKPYLAHILGFNSDLVVKLYEKDKEIKKKKEAIQIIASEIGDLYENTSRIEGILLLKQQEEIKKKNYLDSFDFRREDKKFNKILVNDIDERISELNEMRYSLTTRKKKILSLLEEEQILFNPDEAQKIFEEAGIIFNGQIKKDFHQLIEFNKSITEERRKYLFEDQSETEEQLRNINIELNRLGKERSKALSFIEEVDVFNKYKQVSDDLVTLRADITSLERQRDFFRKRQILRNDVRRLTEERNNIHSQIELDVENQSSNNNSLYSTIRLYFNEIVDTVINRNALLNVEVNSLGYLEFSAQILDQSGDVTSADLGHTYRKLLCIAFDLALLRAHLDEKFPSFVYHDGVFESLDDRKKENLLSVIRQYADVGIQTIITVIDSDIPDYKEKSNYMFKPEEIILLLHDEDESGRLFKFESW